MYYIINKTNGLHTSHEGDFPNVEEWLNEGHKIIIISAYSNTIKVPYVDHEDNSWYWESYPYFNIQ